MNSASTAKTERLSVHVSSIQFVIFVTYQYNGAVANGINKSVFSTIISNSGISETWK